MLVGGDFEKRLFEKHLFEKRLANLKSVVEAARKAQAPAIDEPSGCRKHPRRL